MLTVVILVVPFLAMIAGHYFPWHVLGLANERNDLHRTLSYCYGCGWILITMAAWLILTDSKTAWDIITQLSLVMLAAGLGTVLPRVVREYGENRARDEDERDKGGNGEADEP